MTKNHQGSNSIVRPCKLSLELPNIKLKFPEILTIYSYKLFRPTFFMSYISNRESSFRHKLAVFAVTMYVQTLAAGTALKSNDIDNTLHNSGLDNSLQSAFLEHHTVTITTRWLSHFRRLPLHYLSSKYVHNSKQFVFGNEDADNEIILEEFHPPLNVLSSLFQETALKLQQALIVVKLGNEVSLMNAYNATLDLEMVVDFNTIEETIARQRFRSQGTRLFFMWTVLQRHFNFTSMTLPRYEHLLKKSSPILKR